METSRLNYRDAGVDIDAGGQLVDLIKPVAAKTRRPGVLSSLGGFGALFEVPVDRYRQPVLVSGTDGVGTKLKLAIQMQKHDTIGIDLVAMCVNDIIVQGAEPLFFLDYYATGKLDTSVAATVIKGIGTGCEMAGAALTGGETAEMPGMYTIGEYDLAGFCVGVVEKDKIIDGSKVKAGDVLIGISSSGLHSNGYSLARKVLEVSNTALDTPFAGQTIGDVLLTPTKIYVKPLLELMHQDLIHAAAHITGGGIVENLPRVMPEYTCANVDGKSWTRPPIFDWLQEKGNIAPEEMLRTFNCGIGMVLCVDEANVATVMQHLQKAGETVQRIGRIDTSDQQDPHVII